MSVIIGSRSSSGGGSEREPRPYFEQVLEARVAARLGARGLERGRVRLRRTRQLGQPARRAVVRREHADRRERVAVEELPGARAHNGRERIGRRMRSSRSSSISTSSRLSLIHI